ncbi:hypothetical protein BVX94_02500 [bacterium B17]|nr:hypothetical protein BVX94_02500 [bacterium B17]
MMPLIDVVFLLLVFFIYAMLSMTMHRGLRVALPSGAGINEDREILVITIAVDNSISIDGEPFSMEEAVVAAAARVKAGAERVMLSGDKGSDLGVSIELLSSLRKAGVEAVSFQVQKEQ